MDAWRLPSSNPHNLTHLHERWHLFERDAFDTFHGSQIADMNRATVRRPQLRIVDNGDSA